MTKKIHTEERERWNLTERLHRLTLTVEQLHFTEEPIQNLP